MLPIVRQPKFKELSWPVVVTSVRLEGPPSPRDPEHAGLTEFKFLRQVLVSFAKFGAVLFEGAPLAWTKGLQSEHAGQSGMFEINGYWDTVYKELLDDYCHAGEKSAFLQTGLLVGPTGFTTRTGHNIIQRPP